MLLNFTFIKNIFLRYLVLLIILLAGTIVKGQVKFTTVVAAKEIGIDDYVQVDYSIENAKSVENFSAPDFKNFKVLQGPSQSENVTIINGAISRSKSISYILQPTALGKQVIPGAIAIIEGKTMRSEAVTIQVNKNGSGQGQQPQASPFPSMPDIFEDAPGVEEEYRLREGENVKEKIAKNLIVKLDVNKTTCYEGESIIATYKLCSRVKSESRITKRPSLNGFSVYDMVQPGTPVTSVEKINGKKFNVHLIRRSQLFPLQAGSYTLDPVVLENKVEFLKTSSASSSPRSSNPIQRLMDQFFNREEMGEVEQHSITLQSNSVTITVRPLPTENKPVSFNGAVGKFTIKAELKNKTIAAGDAAQLEVVIKGAGNLPIINAPEIKLPEGMEVFDPLVKEDIDKTVYPLSGSKRFNYTFIAHNKGSFTIPPMSFSYFDPAIASYRTIYSDSFHIQITEGRNKQNNLLANSNKVATSGKSAAKWTDMLSPEMLTMAAIILLLSGVIIYLLVRNRKQEKSKAIVNIPQQEENKSAIKIPADPLTDARIALAQGNSQGFYSELNKALREAHAKGGISEELQAIMKECELALYTPIHEARDMQLLLDRAEDVIKNV